MDWIHIIAPCCLQRRAGLLIHLLLFYLAAVLRSLLIHHICMYLIILYVICLCVATPKREQRRSLVHLNPKMVAQVCLSLQKQPLNLL